MFIEAAGGGLAQFADFLDVTQGQGVFFRQLFDALGQPLQARLARFHLVCRSPQWRAPRFPTTPGYSGRVGSFTAFPLRDFLGIDQIQKIELQEKENDVGDFGGEGPFALQNIVDVRLGDARSAGRALVPRVPRYVMRSRICVIRRRCRSWKFIGLRPISRRNRGVREKSYYPP